MSIFEIGQYENTRRVSYDCGDEFGSACFVPVCKTCGRFVKSDETISVDAETLVDQPNADCSKCGRTKMIFEGFI